MAGLRFSKMHGAGNDFVLLDARAGKPLPDARQIRAMADRHTGIGFDQLLTITTADASGCLTAYRIHNADGSESEQCGNGARCIAAWLHRDGVLPLNQAQKLQSPAGPIGVEVLAPLDIRIEMGEPDFSPARCGFVEPGHAGALQRLEIAGRSINIQLVSMGNPHAVLEVDASDEPALAELGPALSQHPRFKAGCNAGFVQHVDDHHVRLRVHERGAGWTRACGSGACAAAAVMMASARCTSPVNVSLPGGTLLVEWSGRGHPLWMRGPAAFVFEGEWPL
ncbi:MAG: diaminopimelate epimerase [Rhodanobacteraceae bacterium]